MATTGTKLPGLKPIPAKVDKELAGSLKAMQEALAIRLGQLGDPIDRAVTLRELIDSGLAVKLKDNPFDPNAGLGPIDFGPPNAGPGDLSIPPAPVSLTAEGVFTQIILDWNGTSASAPYGNHAYTEIWRSRDNNLAGATLRATTTAFIYTDEVGYAETFYYWVRYVSTSDVKGPFNNTNGVEATTLPDIAAVMEELSEDLSSLPGYQTLIADEFSDIASDLTTLDSAITSINSSVSNLSTATTRVIRSTSAPTQRDDASSLQGSDVWIDTDDNNQVYVRNAGNTGWVKSRDSSLVTLVGTSSFTGSDLSSAMASAQSDIITATSTNNSQATAITNLQSDLSTAESDITTNASAISSLGTRVTTAEGNITSITSDVTTLQSDLTTAQGDITTNASAISGLQTQITSNDGDITTITSDVTALESTLTGYSASSTVASAISGLQTQITANDGDITTLTSDVTALESTLTGYSASSTVASAISGLQTQITANDGDITSLSSSVTSLTSDLSTAEGDITSNASAISSLQTTVTSQGNSISSNASAITSLQSTTGSNSASITTLQTATTNLQNDANAAYVLKVEANGSVSGMVLEANASGAGTGSAVQFTSDKFAIWNGSSGTAPFIVSGGTVFIDNARIQNGAITNAKIGNLAVEEGKIANLAVTNGKIGNLAVTEGKIQNLAVTNAKIADATIQDAKIANLNANKITAGFISADRIDSNSITADKINTANLVLPASGVALTTVGPWATNTFSYQLVGSVGSGAGFYHGYVRLVGSTNHVKTVSLVYFDAQTSAIVYNSGTTDKLPGHVDRFFSSSDSANIPQAFVYSGSNTINLFILAQGDSGPDYLQAEARFYKYSV
jgi:predicted  nucleic acid-binding Zn-ribbon protein